MKSFYFILSLLTAISFSGQNPPEKKISREEIDVIIKESATINWEDYIGVTIKPRGHGDKNGNYVITIWQ